LQQISQVEFAVWIILQTEVSKLTLETILDTVGRYSLVLKVEFHSIFCF